MKTIVALGERAHLPHADAGDLALWAQAWRDDTIRAMHRAPAMEMSGEARDRLIDITSLRIGQFLVVNLLPPDRKTGTWNREMAELYAGRLLTWMQTPACQWTKIIFLGKRVAQEMVDQTEIQFGEVVDLVGIPALCYPHTSGRGERARDWARKFLRRKV